MSRIKISLLFSLSDVVTVIILGKIITRVFRECSLLPSPHYTEQRRTLLNIPTHNNTRPATPSLPSTPPLQLKIEEASHFYFPLEFVIETTVRVFTAISRLGGTNGYLRRVLAGAGPSYVGDQVRFNGLRKCSVKINVETYFSSAREIEYFI